MDTLVAALEMKIDQHRFTINASNLPACNKIIDLFKYAEVIHCKFTKKVRIFYLRLHWHFLYNKIRSKKQDLGGKGWKPWSSG